MMSQLTNLPNNPGTLNADWAWSLHGCVATTGSVNQFPVSAVPFQVGRRSDVHLTLQSGAVSKLHAELVVAGRTCFLRDLGSTNGTFVNGKQISEDTLLSEGDLIQFADLEFRVHCEQKETHEHTMVSCAPEVTWALTQFDQLLNQNGVVPFFQSVVSIEDHSVIGYEVLARSKVQGMESPYQMFQAAERLKLESELSLVCRDVGLQQSLKLPGNPSIFVNTHPAEELNTVVVPSLELVRKEHPEQKIVVEVHEGAVADSASMQTFREQLQRLNVQIAYDDFGAGQSRLLELIEVPPDYLKFDIGLIRNIHSGSPRHQQMVELLVKIALDSGTIPLAEGIECQEEATVCQQIGFELAQGYLFGRPSPIEKYLSPKASQETQPFVL